MPADRFDSTPGFKIHPAHIVLSLPGRFGHGSPAAGGRFSQKGCLGQTSAKLLFRVLRAASGLAATGGADGVLIRYVPGWNFQTPLFAVSALEIIPLAGWMGRATELVAARAGAGIGGLLNATFGNAAELIIGLLALSKGLTGVVKASLTGSILGNMLLVLGASALAGGIRFP